MIKGVQSTPDESSTPKAYLVSEFKWAEFLKQLPVLKCWSGLDQKLCTHTDEELKEESTIVK
jgi:hypothetical protein